MKISVFGLRGCLQNTWELLNFVVLFSAIYYNIFTLSILQQSEKNIFFKLFSTLKLLRPLRYAD